MIGGSPIESPYYPSAYPVQPSYQTYPAQQQPSANRTSLVRSTQTAPNMGQFRMQAADEPASRRELPRLEVPSPDRFGLGAKNRIVEVDWTDVHRRLAVQSITSFHLQKLSNGFRFTIVVPTANGERHSITSESDTDADAIDQALNRAERRQW
jgi:hypothetical protein